MRILNRYIALDNILMFVVSLTIFLFVMAVANIFRVIDLFSRGVSGRLILQVFSYGMPFSLIFAIPMSILTAAFLQFSRMADDREITAMKASGISIWRIVQSPVLVATVLCGVCIYINCSLAPASHYARRKVVGTLGVETPMNLLDEGRFVRDFPGLSVYVGRKYGNRLSDIVVHQFGDKGLKQTLRARSGVIEFNKEAPGRVVIRLRDVNIEQLDEKNPEDLALVRYISAQEYPVDIDMSEIVNRRIIWKKRADFTMREVIDGARGIPVFMCGDISDLNAFVTRLKNPNDRVGAYFRGLLPERAVVKLDVHDSLATDTERESLESALLAALNAMLRHPGLFNEEAFAGVHMDDKTRALIPLRLSGTALTHLNRRLIEAAFPVEIARNPVLNFSPLKAESHRMALMVEGNTRMALSFSCYAFALLGCALGVKIHRKESSIGIAVTLTMIFIFYFFIIIADSLVGRPEFQPHLIVWFPFILATGIGYHFLRRSS